MDSGTDVRDSRDRSNPFVFVVGCQRSGTTMLQRMLDAHPDLTVAYDSLFIMRPLRGVPEGVDPELTPDLVRIARQHPRFDRLGVPDAVVDDVAGSADTYGEFIAGLYDGLARERGKLLAGEKSPGYCRHLPRLRALFPSARILHLIRDGRDIALSIEEWGKGAAKLDLWREQPIAVAALWWRRDVRAGCRDGARMATTRYREVRYEQLVAEPESVLRSLCDFMGLPFSGAMLQYHEGRVQSRPGLSAKAAWLPPTVGIRDWRSQMDAEDIELFEAIAGEELDALGYERRFPSPSASARTLAAECEAWWDAHVG